MKYNKFIYGESTTKELEGFRPSASCLKTIIVIFSFGLLTQAERNYIVIISNHINQGNI